MLRLLAVGDCNTSGVDGFPHDTMPEELKKLFQAEGKGVHLTNLGQGMYSTREGLACLSEYHAPADIALINFGLVDAWRVALPTWYLSYYPDNGLKKFLRKMLKSLKKRMRNPKIRRHLPVGNTVPIDEYDTRISQMIAHIRAHSPDVKIMLWSTVPTMKDTDRNQEIIRYNARLDDIARRQNCLFVDTHPLFVPYSYDELYIDPVHLHAFGQKLIATEIYTKLNAAT